MVTKVACTNPDCPSFNKAKTVVSAMILGMNPKVCPLCGGHMKVVAQVNTSGKGMRKAPKRNSKRSSKRG